MSPRIDARWYTRPPEVTRERVTAGGVVVRFEGGVPLVGLAREAKWPCPVLPKGGIEPGEDLATAARREVHEETGLHALTLIDKLAVLERLSFDRTLWCVTHVFLFTTEQVDGVPLDRVHHPDGPIWRGLDQLGDLLWPDQRQLVLDSADRFRALAD